MPGQLWFLGLWYQSQYDTNHQFEPSEDGRPRVTIPGCCWCAKTLPHQLGVETVLVYLAEVQGPGSHDGRCCSPCSTGAGNSLRNRVCRENAASVMSKGSSSFQCSQWTNCESNDRKECWILYCSSYSRSLTVWDLELTTILKPQRKAWIPFVEDKHNGDT